jgi:hypothetical protein
MEATALRAAALRTTVEQASGTESSLDSDAACLQALLGVSARDWAPCWANAVLRRGPNERRLPGERGPGESPAYRR